jgi:hypothetical protein
MTKRTTAIPRDQIQAAIQALGISVPVYRVERIEGGLRFHLYGRHKPVDYVPEPQAVVDDIEIEVEPLPKRRARRKAKPKAEPEPDAT